MKTKHIYIDDDHGAPNWRGSRKHQNRGKNRNPFRDPFKVVKSRVEKPEPDVTDEWDPKAKPAPGKFF